MNRQQALELDDSKTKAGTAYFTLFLRLKRGVCADIFVKKVGMSAGTAWIFCYFVFGFESNNKKSTVTFDGAYIAIVLEHSTEISLPGTHRQVSRCVGLTQGGLV